MTLISPVQMVSVGLEYKAEQRGKRTWRNDLAGLDLDSEPSVVKVLDVDGTASKSSQEVDLGVVEQVVALALEARVRLLLNLKLNVAGLDAGHLVTFSAEIDPGAALHTLVDVDVQDLALNRRLLSVALLAAVLFADDLALSVAVGADSLEALDHGAHLAHHHFHALTVTASAGLDSALLAAAAVALGAQDRLLQGELGDLALIHVLE